MRHLAQVTFRYSRHHADSLFSISIRVAAVGLGFLVTLAIGRTMGTQAVGQYGIITQTGMFLSIVCVGGLDLSVIRSFVDAKVKGARPSRRSFLKVVAIVLGLMMLVAAGIALSHRLFARYFLGNATTSIAIAVIVAVLFARGFTRLTSSFLRSQGEYIYSQIVEGVVIPALVLCALVIGVAGSIDGVLIATAVAGLVASILGLASSIRKTTGGNGGIDIAMRPLVKRAVPLWGVAISKNLSDWYSLAIVAAMLSLYDAGVFRVAMQIATALPIITIGIFSVYSPKFGIAHSGEDYPGIARLAREATLLSTLLVLPPGLALIVLSDTVLAVFGPDFVAGSTVLSVLLFGQILYVCTGPSGLVLAMTGNERTNLLLTFVSLLMLLIALPLAAQSFGLLGVAIALSLVLALRNLASLIAVKKLTGVDILRGRYTPPTATA